MLRHLESLNGFALAASDGEIGKVKDLYFDDQSWTVRYLVVDTGTWLSGREVLIAPRALGVIDNEARLLAVHLTRDQVRESPSVETHKPVSRRYEELYYQYFRWDPYWVVPGAVPAMWAPPVHAPLPEVSENLQPPEPSAEDPDCHLRSVREVINYAIGAEDGEIGHLEDLIADEAGWQIRYLLIDTRKWLPGKKVLLAVDWISEISFEAREVFVRVPRGKIEGAPEYEGDLPMSREFEERLHQHYDQPGYWSGKE